MLSGGNRQISKPNFGEGPNIKIKIIDITFIKSLLNRIVSTGCYRKLSPKL